MVKVGPDRNHPVSQGYCCVKGLGLGALHHDEDRLETPLKRIDGELVPIGWDQANAEIGVRVRILVDAHGPPRRSAVRRSGCDPRPRGGGVMVTEPATIGHGFTSAPG